MTDDEEKLAEAMLGPIFDVINANLDMKIEIAYFMQIIEVTSTSLAEHPSFNDEKHQHAIATYTATLAKAIALIIEKKRDGLNDQ